MHLPLCSLAEADEEGAGVTVTATPAEVVDEATAVSIAGKERKKQAERRKQIVYG